MSKVERTRELLKQAEFNVGRLLKAISDFNAANEVSWRFLETAYKLEPKSGLAVDITSSHSSTLWLERANNACALAEEVKDPSTKRFLIGMVRSYDEMAVTAID